MLETETGRNELDDYVRLNTTEPDMDSLSRMFKIETTQRGETNA